MTFQRMYSGRPNSQFSTSSAGAEVTDIEVNWAAELIDHSWQSGSLFATFLNEQ